MTPFSRKLFTALAIMTAASANGSETDFVNNTSDAPVSWWGTGKTEVYDLAIRIASPEFIGLDITAVSFPVVTDDAVADFSIWLSKELTLDNKVNSPDIISAPANVSEGTASLTLSTPYRITDGGVYVGLSFEVTARDTDPQKKPIATIAGADSLGVYLHTSRTYTRWAERTGSLNFSIPVTITLAGVPESAAAVIIPAEINAGAGNEYQVKGTIVNRGASVISSATLDYRTADGISGTLPVEFAAPVKAGFNRTADFEVTLPAREATGTTTLTFTAATVNGADNSCTDRTATSSLAVYSHLPLHRPLLEEYTGMGCGWCPRGAIGIEKMRQLYGDRFVAVAHHCDDELSIFTADARPNNAPGQPVAWINRWRETDPYNGDNPEVVFGIDKVWKSVAESFTPADISVEWDWTDASQETIEATATVNFVKAFSEADFRVAYMLVADGLKDENWYQGNYYTGRTDTYPAEFDYLVSSPQYIMDVVFDDAVILAESPKGIEGSLPSEIAADIPMTHTSRLKLSDANNLSGVNLVQDKSRLRVVAIVLDATTGNILNSACAATSKSGLDTVTVGRVPIATDTYDLTGRRVSETYKGIAVRTIIYSDGSRATEKILLR